MHVIMINVTGFGKIHHLYTFIVLINVNLKNSLSYNSAVVSNRKHGACTGNTA